MSAPAIAWHDVTVHYGEVVALDQASAAVDPGRVCGLVGMNGSGKSTLMKATIGLVRPDGGRVEVDGHPPQAARRAGWLSYVPQSEAVDWAFPVSVHDVVMMGRAGHQGTTRRPSATDREEVMHALERVGLADLGDRQIGRLSGGQRKRVFVARAIAQQARILLLDEPFAGVDERSQAAIVPLLRDLAADGHTIVVSTHDLHVLPELCDEVLLLLQTVVAHGPTDQVLRPEPLARAFGLDLTERDR